jgi:hypothetical protein
MSAHAKEGKMKRRCSSIWAMRKSYKLLVRKCEKDHLEDLDVDGWILDKMDLSEIGVRLQTHLSG